MSFQTCVTLSSLKREDYFFKKILAVFFSTIIVNGNWGCQALKKKDKKHHKIILKVF